MRWRLLTFRFSGTLGGFDDSPLHELVRDKELLSFREHFFTVNDVPHLVCVVTYQEPQLQAPACDGATRDLPQRAVPSKGRKQRPDPTAGLDESGGSSSTHCASGEPERQRLYFRSSRKQSTSEARLREDPAREQSPLRTVGMPTGCAERDLASRNGLLSRESRQASRP